MKKVLSFIFIFLAMFIWGTSFLAMKDTLDYISPGMIIFLRSSITFVVLLPFSIKAFKTISKKEIFLILLTGLFVCLGYITQAVGLKYTTPGKSAFLEDAYCIVVPILTCLLLRKKLPIIKLVCILLCVAGVVFISFDSLNTSNLLGDSLSILAGIFYGVNIALTGIYSKKTSPVAYTCGQFFVIAIIGGLYTLAFEDINAVTINKESIFQILYLGLVVTALAWILRNYAQQHLSPITVSIILPFSAVVGAILSVVAGKDSISGLLIIGGLLITASIIVDTITSYKNKQNI